MTYSERWDKANGEVETRLRKARSDYYIHGFKGDDSAYCLGCFVTHLQYALMDLEEARARIKELERDCVCETCQRRVR